MRDTELIHYPGYNVNQRSLLVNGRTQMNGNLTINGNISVNSTNIALGFQAGSITVGTNSVAIGSQAGNTYIGASSTAVGYQSGFNQQGANNTFLGYQAGYDGGVARTGASNTCIGSSTASVTLTAGNNNTCLGAGATVNNSLYYNSTAIGVGATATNSSQIKLGNGETVSIPGSLSAAGITCSTINTQSNTISYGSGSISGTGAITAGSLNLNGSGAITAIVSGIGSSASGVGTVNFQYTFANAPTVVATCNIASAGLHLVMVNNVTVSGFSFNVNFQYQGSTATSGASFYWIAIGK